jgi:hypothetical protein
MTHTARVLLVVLAAFAYAHKKPPLKAMTKGATAALSSAENPGARDAGEAGK